MISELWKWEIHREKEREREKDKRRFTCSISIRIFYWVRTSIHHSSNDEAYVQGVLEFSVRLKVLKHATISYILSLRWKDIHSTSTSMDTAPMHTRTHTKKHYIELHCTNNTHPNYYLYQLMYIYLILLFRIKEEKHRNGRIHMSVV